MLSMYLPLNLSSVNIISAVVPHTFITNLNFVAQNPVWHRTCLFSLFSLQSIVWVFLFFELPYLLQRQKISADFLIL